MVALTLISSAITVYQWYQPLDNCESRAHTRMWLNMSLAIAVANVGLLVASLTVYVHEIVLLVGSAVATVVLGLLLHASSSCVDHHRRLTMCNIATTGAIAALSLYAIEIKKHSHHLT